MGGGCGFDWVVLKKKMLSEGGETVEEKKWSMISTVYHLELCPDLCSTQIMYIKLVHLLNMTKMCLHLKVY